MWQRTRLGVAELRLALGRAHYTDALAAARMAEALTERWIATAIAAVVTVAVVVVARRRDLAAEEEVVAAARREMEAGMAVGDYGSARGAP